MIGKTLDELRSFLRQHSAEFTERDIQYGTQLTCRGGEIINYYPKRGRVVVQGTETALSRAINAWAKQGAFQEHNDENGSLALTPSQDIFIVYGHDTRARKDLELLLHKMGLNPIVLGELPAGGDTIIEKLEVYLGENSDVGFACVLLTPDDEGYPRDQTDKRRYRARQNVILELGMVLGRLGRKRVAILYKESVEQPSDIAGLLYIQFAEQVDEVKTELYKELRNAGYSAAVPP